MAIALAKPPAKPAAKPTRRAPAPIERLIARVPAALPQVPYRRELAERVQFLLDALREEEGPDATISRDSLAGLVAFLAAHPTLRRPSLTASDEGILVAEWRASARQQLVVRYLSPTQVRYALFVPEGDGMSCHHGTASPTALLRLLTVTGADVWCRA